MAQAAKRQRETVERNIATRVKAERQARGWSLETMSKEMEAAGFPAPVTTLHRLEREDPPPRIGVDLALAFCDVFDLTFEELTRAQASPAVTDVALALAQYLAAVEGVAVARHEEHLAEAALLERTRSCSRGEIEEAVNVWRQRSRVDERTGSAFVEFLAGQEQVSPFAAGLHGVLGAN